MGLSTKQIADSDWAKLFAAEAPWLLDEALQIAENLQWVKIVQLDDHSLKGDFVWAIIPDCSPEFWLAGLESKEEALSLAEKMSWRVK
jgi:hypothetical protein